MEVDEDAHYYDGPLGKTRRDTWDTIRPKRRSHMPSTSA
jgi:hypothetical protein